MTERVDLEAILARAEATPEGPWAADHGELRSDVYRPDKGDGGPLIADLSPELAEFIVAARTDVLEMAAELRAVRHQLRQTMERERMWVGMAVAMADQSMPADQPALDGWSSRPTSEEIDAHHAAHAKGGKSWWVTVYPNEVATGRDPYVWVSFGSGIVRGVSMGGQPSPDASWSPRDALLMPVAWPVTK